MPAGAAPGLARRRVAGEPEAWLRRLLPAPLTAELLGEPEAQSGTTSGASGDSRERPLLDALEDELGGLRGIARWVARVAGPPAAMRYTAEVARSAGLSPEVEGGVLVVEAPALAGLRPLLEDAGSSDRLVLIVAFAGDDAPEGAAALGRGDEAAALARARLALLHPTGRPWALLLHDPARSGLVPAPAAGAVAPPRLPMPRRRVVTPARTAAGVAVIAAAALLAAGIHAAQTSSSPSPQGSAGGATAGAGGLPGGVVGPVRPGAAPSVRQAPSSAVDPRDGLTLFFGGIAPAASAGVDLADTWTWDGGRWSNVSTADAPPPRHGGVLAPDPAETVHGEDGFLLVGGTHAGRELDDSWLWSGGRWSQVDGAAPQGAVVAIAADYSRQQLVLVTRGGGGFYQTYVRSEGTWTNLSIPTPPILLLAGDMQRGITGLAVAPGELAVPASTWVWTGASWTEASPATEPEVDVLTATLVAQPGAGPLLAQVDFLGPVSGHGGTWTYDGRNWHHAVAPVPDLLRAFDTTTPVWGLAGTDPVLIGGSLGDDAYRRAVRWDGREWVAL